MSAVADPLEVLAFINGYSTMPGIEWRARFPEWCARVDKARARFQEATGYGQRGWVKGDALVSSEDRAIHHWVFLPLIREALVRSESSS